MNIHLLDIQSDDIDNIFTITLYGKTETNENIVCHINDFKPQFFIKIPKTWNKNKFDIKIMNELTYYPFKSKTPRKLFKNAYYKCNVSICKKFYNDFYVFNPKDDRAFKFVELEFLNYRSFSRYIKSIKEALAIAVTVESDTP